MKRRSRPLGVILFGPPGSGKSTQANLLGRSLGLVRVAPGDILRAHITAGDSLGCEVASVVRAGQLVPDEIIDAMIAERISEPDCVSGFVLDGYPRTSNQTCALIRVLQQVDCDPVVIQLTLDADVAVARLSGRQECARCGALYHVASRPPKVPRVCDLDGAELTVRIDDSEDAIRARLSVYRMQTEPTLKLLSEVATAYKEVPADAASPDVAAERILEWLRTARLTGRKFAAPALP